MEIKIEELKEKFSNQEATYEDYANLHNEITMLQKEFKNLLESAANCNKSDSKLMSLNKRYSKVNSSELISNLNRKGYILKRELGDTFENLGYRLLEQTRSGKRDEVYYGILRIFVSQEKKFPEELVEAFKPIYSDEMFKVFIFSFLSGIITKEKEFNN